MSIIKKVVAVSTAAVLAGSMAACNIGGGTDWVAQVGDEKVPAGVYISMMINEYGTLSNDYVDEAGNVLPVKQVLKEQDEAGVSIKDKVSENTKKRLAEYLAVEKEFNRRELTLDETDIQQTQQMAAFYWQYYGIGAVSEQNGVSYESYLKVLEADTKYYKIFLDIYGEGGEKEVPKSELEDEFYKNYAKFMLLEMEYSEPEEDAAAEEDADEEQKDTSKKTIEAKANAYYERLTDEENPADIEDIMLEYAKENAEEGEEAQTPQPTIIDRENTEVPDKLKEAVFTANFDEPVKIEDEGKFYIFVRRELEDEDFSYYSETVLSKLRFEEFEETTLKWADELTEVTYNDAALNRYTPDKLKFDQ